MTRLSLLLAPLPWARLPAGVGAPRRACSAASPLRWSSAACVAWTGSHVPPMPSSGFRFFLFGIGVRTRTRVRPESIPAKNDAMSADGFGFRIAHIRQHMLCHDLNMCNLHLPHTQHFPHVSSSETKPIAKHPQQLKIGNFNVHMHEMTMCIILESNSGPLQES